MKSVKSRLAALGTTWRGCGYGMRERELERKLVQKVKSAGGICPKFVSPGFDGMPDRILLFPSGKLAFVEVKRKGQKSKPLQLARHELLRRLDFQVFVLDSTENINQILQEVQNA
jgi:hypothetical protein